VKKLVMYGAAHPFALKTLHAINATTQTWECLGFLDDDPSKHGQDILGYSVLGGRSLLATLSAESDVYFFNNVMGHWSRRREITALLESHSCQIASLVDPRIDVIDLQHGKGVFVGAFAHFGASARLGDFTVVMQAAVLGDDTRLGSNVFVANLASIGSRTVVGDDTFVGPSSVTLIDRVVGKRVVIGAGAIVTKDVADDARLFGPAAQPR
jgi:acetyltransferase-like isoleucine patch superfamily enzyme